MLIRVGLAFILGINCCGSEARAQEIAPPPLLKDIPAGATLPQDGTFDVRGLKLGATYEETLAALKELSPSKVDEQKMNMSLNDGRGNIVGFRYDAQAQLVFTSDGAGENYQVEFTPGISGTRAVHISRHTTYSNDASMPQTKVLLESLVTKYGPPSFERRYGNSIDMSWIWFDGKRVTFPNGDPRRQLSSAGSPGTPEGCLTGASYGWRYRFDQNRQELFPKCGVMISVSTYSDARTPDLIRTLQTHMTDKMRFHQAATATDAWLLSEMKAKANAQAPRSGPKL